MHLRIVAIACLLMTTGMAVAAVPALEPISPVGTAEAACVHYVCLDLWCEINDPERWPVHCIIG